MSSAVSTVADSCVAESVLLLSDATVDAQPDMMMDAARAVARIKEVLRLFINQDKETRDFSRGRNCPFTSFQLNNLLRALKVAAF